MKIFNLIAATAFLLAIFLAPAVPAAYAGLDREGSSGDMDSGLPDSSDEWMMKDQDQETVNPRDRNGVFVFPGGDETPKPTRIDFRYVITDGPAEELGEGVDEFGEELGEAGKDAGEAITEPFERDEGEDLDLDRDADIFDLDPTAYRDNNRIGGSGSIAFAASYTLVDAGDEGIFDGDAGDEGALDEGLGDNLRDRPGEDALEEDDLGDVLDEA